MQKNKKNLTLWAICRLVKVEDRLTLIDLNDGIVIVSTEHLVCHGRVSFRIKGKIQDVVANSPSVLHHAFKCCCSDCREVDVK